MKGFTQQTPNNRMDFKTDTNICNTRISAENLN